LGRAMARGAAAAAARTKAHPAFYAAQVSRVASLRARLLYCPSSQLGPSCNGSRLRGMGREGGSDGGREGGEREGVREGGRERGRGRERALSRAGLRVTQPAADVLRANRTR
jgi:hypothetical protein